MKNHKRKHSHRFKIIDYNLKEVDERCSCGDNRTRPTTTKEKKKFKKEHTQMLKSIGEMHKLHHDFDKVFKKSVRYPLKKKLWHKNAKGKLIKNHIIREWRWTGYAMMKRVRSWVNQNPTAQISSCDDDVYAGSMLVLIPHHNKASWHGITVIYIPQCTGEKPTRFFLYPHHQFQLMDKMNHFDNVLRQFKDGRSELRLYRRSKHKAKDLLRRNALK